MKIGDKKLSFSFGYKKDFINFVLITKMRLS